MLIRLQQCSTASKVLVCFSLLCVWETSLWGILILNSGINVWFYNDYSRLKYTATEPFISYHFGGFFCYNSTHQENTGRTHTLLRSSFTNSTISAFAKLKCSISYETEQNYNESLVKMFHIWPLVSIRVQSASHQWPQNKWDIHC